MLLQPLLRQPPPLVAPHNKRTAKVLDGEENIYFVRDEGSINYGKAREIY